jgi:uncharacterized membrane protein YkvA (DUF1232 family)
VNIWRARKYATKRVGDGRRRRVVASETGPETKKRESLLSLVPRIARFVHHLARDPRVPWTVKAALAGLAIYLASPIDIIPDWIPGAGYLDDVLLIGFVSSYVLARVPAEVVREHWGEDVETLQRLARKRGSPQKAKD